VSVDGGCTTVTEELGPASSGEKAAASGGAGAAARAAMVGGGVTRLAKSRSAADKG
jgi:hypothetical protein